MWRPRRLWVVSLVGVSLTCPAVAASPGDDNLSLGGAARASVRPAECGSPAHEGPSRWERARTPGLFRYCALLSRGQAALVRAPATAITLASEADAAFPGRAAPLVLRARAEARAGRLAEASVLFGQARSKDPRALEPPLVLVDVARVSSRLGESEAALSAYRSLVQRLVLLSDPALEARLLVQAGVLAMSIGPEHLSEAAGYLLEAGRRPAVPGLGDPTLAALALVRDRQGRAAEADALAKDASGPWLLEAQRERTREGKEAAALELPPGELDAMIARLAEGHDGSLAADRWRAYLATTPAPPEVYLEHARKRLALLGRSRRGSK